tara:strand:+ start:964 stop:1149 length:186 start_codon:yes stop_codon:yes gene_type:complete
MITTKTKTKGEIAWEVYRDHYAVDLRHMTAKTFITFERWLRLYLDDYEAMSQRMAELRGEV